MGEYFGNVLARAMNRRDVLKGAIFSGAGVFLLSSSGGSSTTAKSLSPQPLSFRTIYPNNDDKITIPEGFEHNVVIRWGDALDNGPNLDWNKIRNEGPSDSYVDRQKNCFGYNCDFVGYLRTSDGKHLLVVNHEYCNPEIMFRVPFLSSTGTVNQNRPTTNESLLMLEAHGLSVVEIRRKSDGSWEYVKGSRYNRRITGSTRCEITGPARGHKLMKTYYDPDGTLVYGTLNNCAAGKTPWGTVLTCEENFHSYFGGNRNNINLQTPEETGLVRSIHQRYGVPGSSAPYYGFMNLTYEGKRRFHIEDEPYESFRFGWVVEVDPMNPNRAPIKRTALGRMKHEAATYAIAPNNKVVIYMGDDERFEYIYKFITKGTYNPNNRQANMDLLDEGELYVAKFNDNGTGEWILIARCEKSQGSYSITVNDRLPDLFKIDPVLCFINTRGAADLLGATMMDRPEDIEWNPVTKSAWVALTSNDRRGNPDRRVGRWTATPQGTIPNYVVEVSQRTDGANPRPINYMGHVLEIMEDNGDPSAKTFRWRIPILCGVPGATDPTKRLIIYGQEASSQVPPISAPDNFVIDRLGNVWIATDGNPNRNRLSKNDGVYVLNPMTRELKMFLSGVPGCEICGPEFSDDWKTFFCAIQHPGEAGEDGGSNDPISRWPYNNPNNPNDPNNISVPRPSVIAVWRKDGRDIFA